MYQVGLPAVLGVLLPADGQGVVIVEIVVVVVVVVVVIIQIILTVIITIRTSNHTIP